MHTIRVIAPVVIERKPVAHRLEVTCDDDGCITIVADAETAATLAGREGFRDIAPTQQLLADCIAEAWYAADCPPVGRDA
jgi:hypothetical protein